MNSLLQTMWNVLIYAKTIKDLCVKNPGRKPWYPLLYMMLGDNILVKYEYPRKTIVVVHIGGTTLPNTMIDLGATINKITRETVELIGLTNLRPTHIILELTNRSKIQPEGILEDVIISVDSW